MTTSEIIHTNAFLPLFLPGPHTAPRLPVMPQRIVDKVLKATDEREVAEAWCNLTIAPRQTAWLNPTAKNAKGPCPGYRLGVSQAKIQGDTEKVNVCGALYQQAQFVHDGHPHWDAVHALWQFTDGRFDPYDDKTKNYVSSEELTTFHRQIASYVAHVFSHQHRTSVLLFLVTGRKMRITRWDRSGTIFTESFDYIEHRDRLRDILWGFSLLERDKQGFDDTATPLDKDDADYAKMDFLQTPCDKDISEAEGTIVDDELEPPYTFKFVRAAFRESLDGHATRYRLTVPVKDGPHRTFLVGKPVFVAPGMSGRGTRGFVAWDNTANRFVFLKDAWRPYYENVETEGKVLRALRDSGVENIPTYVCDGELEQVTVTREHIANSSSNKPPAKPRGTKRKTRASAKASAHGKDAQDPDLIPPCQTISPDDFVNRGKNCIRSFRHYRVVVEEVCLALHKFKTGKQLMTLIRDCVRAHAGAVDQAKILHRDVSAGNMLICPTVVRDENDGKLRVVWRGILSDWELSKSLVSDGESDQACQPVRTGTWQFASAYVLDNPDEPVRIADEIESFHHVSLYNALRYLHHNCTDLQITMFDFFDQHAVQNGRYCCGSNKRLAMRYGELLASNGPTISFLDGNDDAHPINNIFRTMLAWFKARYVRARVKDSVLQPIAAGSSNVDDSRKLDDHNALLSLLDDELGHDWPTDDKVGDQLAKDRSAHVQPVPAPDFNAAGSEDEDAGGADGDDSDEDGDGDSDERSVKRAKTVKRIEAPMTAVDDSIEERPARAALPRSRGNCTRRGTSSRTAKSVYNLRNKKSRT